MAPLHEFGMTLDKVIACLGLIALGFALGLLVGCGGSVEEPKAEAETDAVALANGCVLHTSTRIVTCPN
jgi:hypothetical protein